ncbi:MAG: M48 family metalloprotease [bacterium]
MSSETTTSEVLGGFEGRIPPVRAPIRYRLAILLVGVVMLILPLIYLAICALVGWAVVVYAVHGTSLLSGNHFNLGFYSVLVYLGPIVVGVILVFFLLKPILSRPARVDADIEIDRDAEPLLFAFVEKVCDTVGAPRPGGIRVDSDANASASFTRGVAGMGQRGLTLTIGLPLVAGLSQQQFAGVLAHEFGHFSQGAGMRMSHLIRRVSHWFTRVVYERDQFDAELTAASQEWDWRVSWMLLLARLFVGLSRRILWGLMMIGHLVSAVLLRQMEFDADRYQVHLAGSDAFEATMRRIVGLSTALGHIQSELDHLRVRGWLPDDLAQHVATLSSSLTPQGTESMKSFVDDSKTGWGDTHPAPSARIARARSIGAAGVYRSEAPAAVLFRDFGELSRKTTQKFYGAIFGEFASELELRSVDAVRAESEERTRGAEVVTRYFLGTAGPIRPLAIASARAGEAVGEDPRAEIEAFRAKIASGQAICQDQMERITKLSELYLAALQVAALRDAGFELKGKDLEVPVSSGAAAREFAREKRNEMRVLEDESLEFETLVGRRLGVAVALDESGALRELTGFAESWSNTIPDWFELDAAMRALMTLLGSAPGHELRESFYAAVLSHMEDISRRMSEISECSATVEIPATLGTGKANLRDFLIPGLPDPKDVDGVIDTARGGVSRTHDLRFRLLSAVAERAERVEADLGLAPSVGSAAPTSVGD